MWGGEYSLKKSSLNPSSRLHLFLSARKTLEGIPIKTKEPSDPFPKFYSTYSNKSNKTVYLPLSHIPGVFPLVSPWIKRHEHEDTKK